MDVDEDIDYENLDDFEGDFYDFIKFIFIFMIVDFKFGVWLGYDNLIYV